MRPVANPRLWPHRAVPPPRRRPGPGGLAHKAKPWMTSSAAQRPWLQPRPGPGPARAGGVQMGRGIEATKSYSIAFHFEWNIAGFPPDSPWIRTRNQVWRAGPGPAGGADSEPGPGPGGAAAALTWSILTTLCSFVSCILYIQRICLMANHPRNCNKNTHKYF